MKLLIADKLASEGAALLKKELEVDELTSITPDQLLERISEYDGLVVRSRTQVTKEVIRNGRNLKVIARAGVGVNNIDLDEASRHGIYVLNCPTGNTISAAEHTMALLLSMVRNIPSAYHALKQGRWEKKEHIGRELYKKVMGIIGIGKIGSEVCSRCRAFGMRILAYDPYASKEHAEMLGTELVPLERLLMESDFVTVHVPLNEMTRGLISKGELRVMKPTAMIINCARGGIIDEEALYDALKKRKIAKAALDVYSIEPVTDHPLFGLENVIITPHLGASTSEAQKRVAVMIAEEVRDALLSEKFHNVVNMPAMITELPREYTPYLLLAQKIGKLHFQLLEERAAEINIRVAGEVRPYSDFLAVHMLKGFLEGFIQERVNAVNAFSLAQERGLTVSTTKVENSADFTGYLGVTLKNTGWQKTIKGTIFGRKYLRIIRIDDYILDFYPEGNILLIKNQDVPGVIGKIGTLLGEHQLNIAEWRLGRAKENIALAVLNLDNKPDPEVLEKINKIKEVISIKSIDLG